MTFMRKRIGAEGEAYAVAFLERQGYVIEEVNFRNRIGEVDIVARDGEMLVFIEVKTRQSVKYGSPFEAVTPSKQRKLIRMALSYLNFKQLKDINVRFDVVAILSEDKDYPEIDIIKNAFEVC